MESSGLRYLDPKGFRARQPEGGAHLRVEIEGDRTILSARIRRVFPQSEPDAYLSVQDGEGKEVGILRTLEGIDEETRELVRRELDRRYFTPKIKRIDVLRLEAGMWRFEVETGRGATEFFVRNWRDSAHEISAGRWLIHSVDGGRFEIPDLQALDLKSQRLMEQLL